MTDALRMRAPVRIDFGGGWTDVPPYCEEQGGFVCNVAISRYATATLTVEEGPRRNDSPPNADLTAALIHAALKRADRLNSPLKLGIESDFPVGAGLGGSSAAGVAAMAVLAASAGRQPPPEELAESSRSIEVEELGIAGGRQDHYAAAFGGALALEFGEGVTVNRLSLDATAVDALESSMLVVYTGRSRISGETITGVLDAYRAREPRVVSALRWMNELARRMVDPLQAGKVEELGRLVGEHWVHQRKLHPAITTPEIERIMSIAAREGAWGAKALGASGGGCVAVLGEPGCLTRVASATRGIATPLSFTIDRLGVHAVDEGDANAARDARG